MSEPEPQKEQDLCKAPPSPVFSTLGRKGKAPLTQKRRNRNKVEDDVDFTPSQTECILQSIEIFENNALQHHIHPQSTVLRPQESIPKQQNTQIGAIPEIQTASGKPIVSKDPHTKLFDDLLNNSMSERVNKYAFLSKSAVKDEKRSESRNTPLNVKFNSASAKNIFGDEDFSHFNAENRENVPLQDVKEDTKIPMNLMFKSASDKPISLRNKSAKNIFGNEDLSDLFGDKNIIPLRDINGNQETEKESTRTPLNVMFKSASNKSITLRHKSARNIFGDEHFSDICQPNIPPILQEIKESPLETSEESGSNSSLKRSQQDDEHSQNSKRIKMSDVLEEVALKFSKNSLVKAEFPPNTPIEFFNKPSTSHASNDYFLPDEEFKNLVDNHQNEPAKAVPKIVKNKFKSPLLINFERPTEEQSKSPLSSKKRLGMSYSRSHCKQMKLPEEKMRHVSAIFKDCPLPESPIKTSPAVTQTSVQSPARSSPIVANSPLKIVQQVPHLKSAITMQQCTKGDIDVWIKDIERQSQELQRQMLQLSEKHKALTMQKQAIAYPEVSCKRQFGILYHKKQNPDRLKLSRLRIQSNAARRSIITPQNAELVHFICTDLNEPTVKTSDGAVLIPNSRNLIGFSEIETAFKAMPSVDLKLIPKNWIKNHLKLIVWKLSSYENCFQQFSDCLNVENVVQQLKYRYDRELERAERSALRKILEKDDVAQKRMVLCVSNIIKTSEKVELELSDGWYCIKTSMDEPLSKQVQKYNIVIGTKLMVCGAELLNCDGCHPLEVSDLVRLRITANSTRRTIWHSKLGYVRCPLPFPIKFDSILFEKGGLIGAVKIRIVRTYSVKYLEKDGTQSVWRNKKAEEKREREWQMEHSKAEERCREEVFRSYEKMNRDQKKMKNGGLTSKDLSEISCPARLYEAFMKCKDPENLQNLLSPSQQQALLEYQNLIHHKRQSDMNSEVQKKIANLNLSKRNVTPVLTLLVTDALVDIPKKPLFLQIWYPTSSNHQTLKEGSVFTAYNLMPKKNCELCTIKKSQFKPETVETKTDSARKLYAISQLCNPEQEPMFRQFDTVGMIVKFNLDSFDQVLWLAESCGSLLFVKVFDGPKNCTLFDTVSVGDVIAMSNLLWSKPKFGFAEAIANYLTTVSKYPSAEYLRGGIEALTSNLPKDLEGFLKDCNSQIALYLDTVTLMSEHKSSSMSLATQKSTGDQQYASWC